MSAIVYIWKCISTYLGSSFLFIFLFFLILNWKGYQKKKAHHHQRQLSRPTVIFIRYRGSKFNCASTVSTTIKCLKSTCQTYVCLGWTEMQGSPWSVHTPPSKHRINCEVGEKQTWITVVVKNADEQLNEACNRILSYFQTRRTAKTLFLTPGTSIN